MTPGGRLDAAGAPEVETRCKALIQQGSRRLLVDLRNVDYISSAGLRSLLVLAKAMRASAGAMVVCSLTPTVREIMVISGFDHILSLAEDRPAAMARIR